MLPEDIPIAAWREQLLEETSKPRKRVKSPKRPKRAKSPKQGAGVGEPAEAAEVGEPAEVAEAGGAAEVGEAAEVAEAPEAGGAAELAEAGEAAEAVEATRQSGGAELSLLRSPTATLFRPEVVAAQREQALGSVLLVHPVSATVLTLAALAFSIGLVALLVRGEYTRKARVAGYLVPKHGLIKVYSRETGTIVQRNVAEGQQVSKGDTLFVVSMERGSSDTPEAQAAAIAKLRERRGSLNIELVQQDEIAQIETQGLQTRIIAMESELAQIERELVTQGKRVASSQNILEMYRKIFARSLGSAEQVEEKQKDVLEQQGKLEALQRDRMGITRELETLQSQVAASEVKALTQHAGVERNISTLEQELTEYESRRTFVVTAPSDGTATAVLADVGQTANPTQPLLSLLPADAGLQAHLFVPSHSIGFVADGQEVALRYQAFPYQRFGSYGGRITEISRTLIMPNETILPIPLPEPAYRVVVMLDSQTAKAYGQEFPLQSGMILDANISIERRKLYQWLLDPLYSVRGRI
jgi:membrane fusion protein